MSQAIPFALERSLSTSEPWLVLSPHLDDAILSCAALLEAQAGNRKLIVATLFTECSPGPHTRAAKSYLRQCSAPDAPSLFAARRQEDADALADLGASFHHLGAQDALFRRRDNRRIGSSVLSKTLPELVHRYPTYRFDIALGRISRGDADLVKELLAALSEIVEEDSPGLVFSPLAVGKHVDHLITRIVGCQLGPPVVFYSDFPYNQHHQPDEGFLQSRKLMQWEWTQGLEVKQQWVHRYKTQVNAMFPSAKIPVAAEVYFAEGA